MNREERAIRRTAMELLAFLDLEAVAHDPAAGLSFGTLKRVELARALAGRPKLLLLDEPAGGLNHEEVAALGRLIRSIREERQVTVLLVEHHMNLVMQVSDRVVVLDFGRKIAEGSPEWAPVRPEYQGVLHGLRAVAELKRVLPLYPKVVDEGPPRPAVLGRGGRDHDDPRG